MLIRREHARDVEEIRALHLAAFVRDGNDPPVEAGLVDELRRRPEWHPALSLVALGAGDAVVGHVVCTGARVGEHRVLGLGPLGVLPERQGHGVGSALMHAVLGAADALDVPLVGLLGEPGYYRRFGFLPAAELGIQSPDPAWGDYFQVRPLAAYRPAISGRFDYAEPFSRL